jgi:hypothetical protein
MRRLDGNRRRDRPRSRGFARTTRTLGRCSLDARSGPQPRPIPRCVIVRSGDREGRACGRVASVLADRAQLECARSMRVIEATRLTAPLACMKVMKRA